ncbi:hypothetical protein ACLKA7_015206 [Drosophila subpalustris]
MGPSSVSRLGPGSGWGSGRAQTPEWPAAQRPAMVLHGLLVLARCQRRCRGCCSLVAHLICPTTDDDNDMEIRWLYVLCLYPVHEVGRRRSQRRSRRRCRRRRQHRLLNSAEKSIKG